MGRLVIIGLDALDPRTVFETHSAFMPNLVELAGRGTWSAMRSTFPPITVPAWVSMTTGRDPGELGMYGFRERVAGTYGTRLHDARDVRAPRIWDEAARMGKRSVVLGVPLSWPPPGDMEGILVTGLMTPPGAPFACPRSIEGEITSRFGTFLADVEGFRDEDREGLLDRIVAASTQRFEVAGWLMGRTRWDLMMVVDTGIDRFQHAFLRCLDPQHPAWKAEGQDPAAMERGRRFLETIDRLAGQLIERAGPDTTLMVLSDHGVRSLEGSFAVNDWLISEGYLVPREVPSPPARLEPGDVDWSRTRAWAEGGYVARINLSLEGREPEGIVEQGGEEPLLGEIAGKLEALGHRAVRPADVYRETRGFPPDLVVELGGLALRAAATCGHEALVLTGNDTGPDDANHDHDGTCIVAGPAGRACERIEDVFGVALEVLRG